MKYSNHSIIFLTILFICLFNLYAQINLEPGINLLENQEFEKAKEYLLSEYDKNEKDPEVNFYLGRCCLMLQD